MKFFGKHYRMEQFSIIVCVLLILMLGITCVCFAKDMDKNKIRMTEQAKYTSSFTTSVSNNAGSVVNVFVNEDKTKAFILVYFEDVTTMPSSADDYRLYLTTSNAAGNNTKLDQSFTGSWYVFGSTGYMGAYLVNENGFSSQILRLTCRMMKTLSTDSSSFSSSSNSDAFDMYFNLGAEHAQVSESLGTSNVEPATLYYELVGYDKEIEIKNTLLTDLQTMQTNLVNVDDLEYKLVQQDNLKLPTKPALVAGDSINVNADARPVEINTVFAEKPSGAYDIDWLHVDITKGECLKTLLEKESRDKNMSYVTYFNAKNVESKNSNSTSSNLSSSTKWYFANGDAFVSSSTDTMSKQIANDISSYTSALTTYQTNKTKYFVTDMKQLVSLEQEVMSMNDVTTHNMNDNALTLWG